MNLQEYVKRLDPQKLDGDELTFLRGSANELVKSAGDNAVMLGVIILRLLNHIDYITLVKMKEKP